MAASSCALSERAFSWVRLSKCRKTLVSWTVLSCAFLLASCASNPEAWRWKRARTGAFVQPQAAALTVDQERVVSDLCPAGMPLHLPNSDVGATEFVVRRGYALEFSNELKVPLWVCEHVTAAQLNGDIEREDKFEADPLLRGPRSELSDYKGSGYDRGHQAPAADQTVDPIVKAETFYLSNMAPQVPAFNEQIWGGLEDLARSWAKKYGEVWVVTGGMLYDPKEDNPKTADGWIKYVVIGRDGVAIPTHFYKIVARKESGHWIGIGFVLENRKYPRPYDFTKFITPLREIEARTGIDFLPDDGNETLEDSTPTLWQ
jgi:endonuclease G, mitochondrial